jgi:hypothetical protein
MTPVFFTIITITISIVAFLIIQLIYNLHRQKKGERLLYAFEEAATGFGVSISKRQISDHWIIGFDEAQNRLLYLRRTGKKVEGYLVDLSEVKSCTVIRQYVPFWNGSERTGVSIGTISLRLTYKNGAKPLVFPFYNNRIDPAYDLKDRAQQATAWQKFISSHLTKSNRKIEKQTKFVGGQLLQI